MPIHGSLCAALRPFSAAALLLAASPGAASDWPGWRGPDGTGVSPEKDLPLRWGTNENIRWHVALPERGNSTPIVWGHRVFVAQAIEKENRRTLMCFDRSNGKLIWDRGITYSEPDPTHETNPHCSASPVTDGEHVIAWFGSAGLYCYDFAGRERWHRDLGPQRHIWGYGSSPILRDNLCILNFGPGERTFLIAVDKRTGQEVWRTAEPGGDSGEERPGQERRPWIGSWSTPIVVSVNGREELLMSWPKRVAAFDPKTGREWWTCAGLNDLAYTSPLFDRKSGIVVAMGGFMGRSLAVRAGGSGDVTETHRRWHHLKTKQRIGSGVIHDGYVYILNDPGVAECFELETGRLVWEERLRGSAPKSDNWSSMVSAGDKLYVINQGGDGFVLKASPKFTVLATNSLGETTMASLAPSEGQFFIRTYKNLWCVGR